jgi:Xaa-Pro aminopeptidase
VILQRRQFVRNILNIEGLDALLVFGLPNIRYLCGFTGTDGVLYVGKDETVFLTDSRYFEQAEKQVNSDRVICYKNKVVAVGDLLKDLSANRVGFDAEVVAVSLYQQLQLLSDTLVWQPITEQLSALRGIKSVEEITLLKESADLNYRAFNAVLPTIKTGMSEREISLALEFELKRLGGEENAFDFIVASGARGALPHGVASHKILENRELVTIDFGTRVGGYHSDETVTFAIGTVERKLRQIFDIVLEAHDSAIKAVRPGLAIADLDAVARNHIIANGFGEYFGHGLGHGVGLEIHEYPGVSSRSEVTLAEGMVITIEPGIYLPEVGGVRIEDTVVVTADGYEILTSIPKQFMQL